MARQLKEPFPVRLQNAIEASEIRSKPMLNNRMWILDLYASGWYEDAKLAKARPLNIVYRYFNIMMPFLASNAARSVVRAIGSSELSGFANISSKAINHWKMESDYIDTLRDVVFDSLSYMGMSKVGMCHKYESELNGHTHQIGQVYFDCVDPDDIVFDVSARRKKDLAFIGHKYRLPLEYIKTCGLYKKYEGLKPDSNLYASTSPEKISKGGTDQDFQELHETVTVYDIYLPNEGTMITLPCKGQGQHIMRTVDEFPEEGPFDLLTYNNFPGTIIPIPPSFPMISLDDQLNRLARRIDRQSNREKKILVYEGIAADDAERVLNTQDGEAVKVNNIDRMKEISLGGVDQSTISIAEWLRHHVSEQAGNLDSLGGVKAQAKTLGQEQMIAAQSRGPVFDMLEQVHKFCKRVERKVAWYLWHDPLIKIPMVYEIPGTSKSYTITYSDEAKEGDFYDYNFDIVPYSTQGMSPDVAYQRLLQVFSQVVMPVLPLASQQGFTVDIQKLMTTVSQFIDMPDLQAILTNGQQEKITPGPYQPLQGQVKSKSPGQPDGRTGMDDGMANFNQQQARAGGQSSPPQQGV